MTLKVVRISSEAKPALESARESRKSAEAQARIPVTSTTPAAFHVRSEAAHSSVRVSRAAALESEKIKDYRAAKEVADEVAERVLEDDEESVGAHSDIDKVPAKEHLAS